MINTAQLLAKYMQHIVNNEARSYTYGCIDDLEFNPPSPDDVQFTDEECA